MEQSCKKQFNTQQNIDHFLVFSTSVISIWKASENNISFFSGKGRKQDWIDDFTIEFDTKKFFNLPIINFESRTTTEKKQWKIFYHR